MTPHERWLAILNNKPVDRQMTDYWTTPEFNEKLRAHLGTGNDLETFERLGLDSPVLIEPPRRADRPLPADHNHWGVKLTTIEYGTGSYEEAAEHPLADMTGVDEIHRYAWPDPDDYDYAQVTRRVEELGDHRSIQALKYEPFLIYCQMRGMEKAFEDLLLDTDIADAILGHLFDFHYEQVRRTMEAGRGRIKLFCLAEDLGAQTGPLMGLETYRRFLKPNQIRMAEMVRSFGVHIFYHTDGAARIFLDDLIDDVGIEVLNPLQWQCPGMELPGLARDFGDRIVFHGGIDNQKTLPWGTPKDVRAEVEQVRDWLDGCRWICAPCHNIQPVTPVENFLAMLEAAKGLAAV